MLHGGPEVAAVADRLLSAGCVAAEEEADELITAAPDQVTLDGWLRRREQGEPLAWILGGLQFCGRRLRVDPGVYVPRFETEELARRAAALLPAAGHAADLCTGAGAVAAHLRAEDPAASVVGVDVDRSAVACARANGVRVILGDLGGPLRSRAFDLVTAVVPYVPTEQLRFLPADVQRYEPRTALDGGHDGLVLLRRTVDAASRLLRPGGWLLVELGGDQHRSLEHALNVAGFGPSTVWFDEDGDLRGLATQRGDRDPVPQPARVRHRGCRPLTDTSHAAPDSHKAS